MKLFQTLYLTSIAIFVTCLLGASAQQTRAAGPDDWPTYMHDSARTGVSPAEIKLPLRLKWTYQARHAPQPAWPPPAKDDLFHKKFNLPPRVIYDRAFHVVGAGDSVYFASSADDKVYCLDAATGREKWVFYTEGPVRLAPTIADDKVLFGSDDGFVYCLNAADGKLIWKVTLAPGDRRIPGNGRVISAWPVRTGVLVENGRAHFCAGLFAAEGIYYGAVEVASGKKLAEKKINESVQGYLELRGGKLFAPTGRRPKGAWLGEIAGGSAAAAKKAQIQARYPYAGIASASLRFGGGDGEVAAFEAASGKKLWSAKVKGKAYSLAIAAGSLLVGTDKGMIYCFSSGAGVAGLNAPLAAKPLSYADDATRKSYADAAERILKLTPRRKGYCLVLNSGQGRLAYELAGRSEFKIVCREADAAKVAESRAAFDAAGLYGRVAVHHGPADKLPYADYMFNLVVHDELAAREAFAGSRDEVMRVVSPCGGVALFSSDKRGVFCRGPLKGAGAWSHFYADAGNSACSGETLVRPPFAVQWFGPPGPRPMVDRHNRGAAPAYANGRLFVSGYDYVAAVDAYNGTVLWERDLEGSSRVAALKNCGNMAATDDVLYVAAKDCCLALNAASGKLVWRSSVPADGDWGYVACVGELLIGSRTKPGASRYRMSPSSWKPGYSPNMPVVCSDSLFACGRKSGAHRWVYNPKAGVIANPTIAAGDGRIYFVESGDPETQKVAKGRVLVAQLFGKGADLVALDLRNGKPVWRKPIKAALRHALYLSFADGKLLLTGCRVAGKRIFYDMQAFDAATGKPAWQASHCTAARDLSGGHGELTQHPAVAGGKVYIYEAAFDLETGNKVADWQWKRGGHGCGTISSSATALFYRGNNPQMTELDSARQTRLTHETRPGCWINIIPAGGLVLIPEGSSGCTCPYAIQTSMALAPVKQQGQ